MQFVSYTPVIGLLTYVMVVMQQGLARMVGIVDT